MPQNPKPRQPLHLKQNPKFLQKGLNQNSQSPLQKGKLRTK